MKPGQGKHNRARERLQQKAAANRASRLPPGAIAERKNSQESLATGGAFKPLPRPSKSLAKFTPIQRAAYYVGSFAFQTAGQDIAMVVEGKIRSLTINKDAPGRPVKVVILKDGIKIFQVDGETPFMAHALMRISLSMGFRSLQAFAFVARNPSAKGGETLCHVLYCTKPDVPDELSNLVSEAFELAFADVLSSKGQMAHAPTAVAKTKLKQQTSEESLQLQNEKCGTLESRVPSLPEDLSLIDVEEQKRLLQMYSKGAGRQRPPKPPVPAAAQQTMRTPSDEQRRIREDQQEKMMKRLMLIEQREELLKIKKRQDAAKEAVAASAGAGTGEQPAKHTTILKKRVVHRKAGDGSPQVRRATAPSSGSSSPAVKPHSSSTIPAQKAPAPSPHDTAQHETTNVLPLPPRSSQSGSVSLLAGGSSKTSTSDRQQALKGLRSDSDSIEGKFLPGGGFLPDREKTGTRVKPPDTTNTYDEVSADAELVALARIARETMKRAVATETQARKSQKPVQIFTAGMVESEDGYIQPVDAPTDDGSYAQPLETQAENAYVQPLPPGTQVFKRETKTEDYDNIQLVPPKSASLGSTESPRPAGPRRVKRVSAQELRQSASVDDARVRVASQPQKAVARMSTNEPLSFLANAAAGLGLQENPTGADSDAEPTASEQLPTDFLEKTADGLLADNERELQALMGKEFEGIDIEEQKRLLASYAQETPDGGDADEEIEMKRGDSFTRGDSIAESSDEMNPEHAHWFQSSTPRHVAMEMLARQQNGAFIVRVSSSHENCFALSLKTSDGLLNFLIEQTEDETLRLSGQSKCFADLGSLISFHCHTPGPLPCTLSLVKVNPRMAHGGDEDDSDDEFAYEDAIEQDDYFNLPAAENVILL